MKYFCQLLSILGCLMANSKSDNAPSRAFQIIRHNINQVEICVSNYGTFGQDETGNNAGCWWPIGTSHTYIYGAGIWFGTIDSLTGDTLVTAGYIPQSGAAEYAPGLSGMSPSDTHAIIYIYPSVWPPDSVTFPMAPQVSLSHQDSWCCYNDSDIVYHVAGDTRPIGIEVYQTVYAWNSSAFENVVWFFVDVKNVSGSKLNDCYIAITTDCDIGNEAGTAANDRCSGVIGQWYYVGGDSLWVDDLGYQWQDEEEPGAPPWFPGTIGFDLLQTPFDLVEGYDKDMDGIPDQYERDSAYYVNNLPSSMWDVDYDGLPDWRDASENPQFGLTALKRFMFYMEPSVDPQRYMTLAGYDFQTGLYEPYDTIPSDPGDQRFLMSSGPFDFGTDSVVTIGFAIFFADWHNIYMAPDSAFALRDTYVQWYYDQNWFWPGIAENRDVAITTSELIILPNPISGRGVISYSMTVPTEISLKLYNLAGQLVRVLQDQRLDAGKYSMDIDTHDLPLGMYFLVLETPTRRQSQAFVVIR